MGEALFNKTLTGKKKICLVVKKREVVILYYLGYFQMNDL